MERARVEESLESLGHTLPLLPPGSYSYSTVVRAAGLIYVSGQIPKVGDSVAWKGAVGHEVSVEDAQKAAEICALNILGQVDAEMGFSAVERLVKLNVYVASSEAFLDQPTVAEGASKFMRSVLGEAGKHARTAIGVPRLPKDASVEVEAIFAESTASPVRTAG